MAVSMTEKFANNMMTIVIARVAMIVTPVIIGLIGWAGLEIWKSMDERISALEQSMAKQSSQIQDHESRITFSSAKAETFEAVVDRRFSEINGTLKELNAQISGINGSLIRLQTTIENRLPQRESGPLPSVETPNP